jgi:thiol-disulfide isomerase/thioredoxin
LFNRSRRAAAVFLVSSLAFAGGHSAFSASPQDAAKLDTEFAPVTEAQMLSDLPVSLADKEKVVLAKEKTPLMLINVWATWCAPCVEEMPSLDALEKKMGSDKFQVAAVSMDRQGMEVVAPFFQKEGITALKPYTDTEGAFARAIGAQGLPMTILVKDGKIVRRIVGPADWSSAEAEAIIKQYM